MIRAVVFDVDGTLVNSVDLHAACWRDTLAKFGVIASFEAVRWQIGKGGDQLMPVFLPAKMIEREGMEIEAYRSELFTKEYLPKVTPFPMVKDLFKRIRNEGKRIALASSAKEAELAVYKRLTDIEDLIDLEVSADGAAHSKPCPDIFESALAQLMPTDSADVVVVGDTPYDAIGAARAGLRTVGVLSGGFPIQVLREAGCVAVYQDPRDLLANYESSPLCFHPQVSLPL